MNISSSGRAAATAAVVLVLSSCSTLSVDRDFLDRPPSDIAQTGYQEMLAVKSVRILGSAISGYGMTHFDIRVDDGGNCVGSFDTEEGVVELIQNTEGVWFQPDKRFWLSQATTPQQRTRMKRAYQKGWLEFDDKHDFEELCDMDEHMVGLTLDPETTLHKIAAGEVERIDGADAVAISGADDIHPRTVWVAVDSPHYVLKVAPSDDPEGPGTYYFKDFNVEVIAESPAEADIIKPPVARV